MQVTTTQPLWRVWRNGRYTLVRAADSDAVYRSFRKRQREQITCVEQVRKTSDVLAEMASTVASTFLPRAAR